MAALLAVALLLPSVVNLGRYRRRVGDALSKFLNRPVDVGGVHLQLLPWPALVAENVVIGELPALGSEPLAHMSELRATLRLSSLLTGRPRFSSVVFIEPSVNLSRGHFSPAAVPAPAAGATGTPREFPYVEVRDGRLNFKDGDVKQVFYFSQVEGAVFEDGGRLRVRLAGRPARTDRELNGAGEIRVEGELSPQLDINARLIDSFLSDFLALPTGVDPGIQGHFGVDVHFTGHMSALRFEGAAQVTDLRRRDLLPPISSPAMRAAFTGSADVPGRHLDLSELRSDAGTAVAFGSVHEGGWDFQLRLKQADAGRWFSALKYFSPRLAGSNLVVTGGVDGSVHIKKDADGVSGDGSVMLADLHVKAGNVTFDAMSEARVEFSGPTVELNALQLATAGESPFTVAGVLDWTTPVRGPGTLQVSAAGQNLSLANVSPLAAALGWPGVPGEGQISVNARMNQERDQMPVYTGTVALQKAKWTPVWLAQPVTVHTATIAMSPHHARVSPLVLETGESTVTGTLEKLDDVWQADLRVNELSAAGIVALFSTRQPIPDAVRRVEARGKIQAGRLHLRALVLEDLQATFGIGDGATTARLTLRDARASLGKGRVAGRADIAFGSAGPEYDVAVKVADVQAQSLLPNLAEGPLAGTVEIQTHGKNAAEIADSFALTGSLTGRAMRIRSAPLAAALQVERAGTFAAEVKVSNRALHFSRLAWTSLEGSGTVGFDRALDLDFKTFKLGGTLSEPKRITP